MFPVEGVVCLLVGCCVFRACWLLVRYGVACVCLLDSRFGGVLVALVVWVWLVCWLLVIGAVNGVVYFYFILVLHLYAL